MLWCKTCQMAQCADGQDRCEWCLEKFCDAPTRVMTIEQKWARLRKHIEAKHLTEFYGVDEEGRDYRDNHIHEMAASWVCQHCHVAYSPKLLVQVMDSHERTLPCGHRYADVRVVLP